MKTSIEKSRDDAPQLSVTLSSIRRAADEIDELSLGALRQRINDVHAFLVHGILSDVARLPSADQAELSRLDAKLDALRERLVYGYFRSAQLRSLQEVFYDVHAIIERRVAEQGQVDLTVVPLEVSALSPTR